MLRIINVEMSIIRENVPEVCYLTTRSAWSGRSVEVNIL